MRTTFALLAALAIACMSDLASAAPADNNTVVLQFSVAVTAAAQGFTIESKVIEPGRVRPPVTVAGCSAWSLENDSATETIWIKWSVAGGTGQPPVALNDAGNTRVNQMRLKPGQVKTLQAFSNTYMSVIATGTANLHAEQTCPGIY